MPDLIPPSLTVEQALSLVVIIGLAILVLAVGALVLAVVGLRRLDRLQRHYTALMTGVNGEDVAAALEDYVGRVSAAEHRLSAAEEHAAAVDLRLRGAVRNVSLLRYSAFEDSGGDQSFTLALLDDARDGVVLSGLYGRAGVRVYAKPVTGGRSAYALSTEEQRAIDEAAASAQDG